MSAHATTASLAGPTRTRAAPTLALCCPTALPAQMATLARKKMGAATCTSRSSARRWRSRRRAARRSAAPSACVVVRRAARSWRSSRRSLARLPCRSGRGRRPAPLWTSARYATGRTLAQCLWAPASPCVRVPLSQPGGATPVRGGEHGAPGGVQEGAQAAQAAAPRGFAPRHACGPGRCVANRVRRVTACGR